MDRLRRGIGLLKGMASGSSWTLTTNAPEQLQLVAHIGEREGFSPVIDTGPVSAAEAQWREHWLLLPSLLREYEDAFRRVMPELERATSEGRDARGIVPERPPELMPEPPEFAGLEPSPLLQGLYRRHWDDFQEGWRRVGVALQKELRSPPVIVVMRDLAAVLGHKGRRSDAFQVRVDFVRWPRDYEWRVSGDHFVLGWDYLEGEGLDRLRRLLWAQVDSLP